MFFLCPLKMYLKCLIFLLQFPRINKAMLTGQQAPGIILSLYPQH